MKKIYSIPLLLFIIPTLLFSQNNNWGAFTQKLDAIQFGGKKFRLEAAVKTNIIDSFASAEIWFRVDKKNKKTGFFYNMYDKPILSREWKTYTITGKIDKDADSIAFGGLYFRKGVFYFDAFKLFIETSRNKFEEINLPNGDFEQDAILSKDGWQMFQPRKGYTLNVSKSEFYSGKQSCIVDGSKFKKSEYGENEKAGKFAVVNGIKLYYETYGDGEPLLLLHGNSMSISSFHEQIPELMKKYKVIAVDTRGHGQSTEDGKRYTYDLFADDMNAFLNYLNLDSVNILGWSDGGNTGLIMSMKYPKKVKKLVTMGACIFIDNTVVDKWVFKELNKQLKELRSDTTYESTNRVRHINLLLTEPKHTFNELEKITCPVLVVAGEKDVIKENHTKNIASHISHATLVIAPKQTHYYPWEDSKQFNKTVLDFLK